MVEEPADDANIAVLRTELKRLSELCIELQEAGKEDASGYVLDALVAVSASIMMLKDGHLS